MFSRFGFGRKSPIEAFRAAFFPRSEDDAWKLWVDTSTRDYQSLVRILTYGGKEKSFRARALIVLLAADEGEVPIYWKSDRTSSIRSMLEVLPIDFRSLPRELLPLAAELVAESHAILRVRRADKPSLRFDRALNNCNQYVLQLLELMDVREAYAVWDHFDINDPAAFQGEDGESGYNPWRQLMSDDQIPMYWKYMADDVFRKVIDDEMAGIRGPRMEWESAFRKYIDKVGLILQDAEDSLELAYDLELLASQLDYIMSKGPGVIGNDRLMEGQLATAMQLLAEHRFRSTRQALLQFEINHPTRPSRVHDADSLRLAEQMLLSCNGALSYLSYQLRGEILANPQLVQAKEREDMLKKQRLESICEQLHN